MSTSWVCCHGFSVFSLAREQQWWYILKNWETWYWCNDTYCNEFGDYGYYLAQNKYAENDGTDIIVGQVNDLNDNVSDLLVESISNDIVLAHMKKKNTTETPTVTVGKGSEIPSPIPSLQQTDYILPTTSKGYFQTSKFGKHATWLCHESTKVAVWFKTKSYQTLIFEIICSTCQWIHFTIPIPNSLPTIYFLQFH